MAVKLASLSPAATSSQSASLIPLPRLLPNLVVLEVAGVYNAAAAAAAAGGVLTTAFPDLAFWLTCVKGDSRDYATCCFTPRSKGEEYFLEGAYSGVSQLQADTMTILL